MKVQILIDNPESWYLPYGKVLIQRLLQRGIDACLCMEHKDVTQGDVLCLIGCERKFEKLDLNTHNLVVHESSLPEGKGWSPLTWQILEGKNEIPITLFEATEEIDAGIIYQRDMLQYRGDELLDEIKQKQGLKTNELILRFIDDFPNVKGEKQIGAESFYNRRKPKDSMLDINKTIEEQFNLFRVCDNVRYPAFFILRGEKYILEIKKEPN